MEGKVKFFNISKNYGFIDDGGMDYFFHVTDVQGSKFLEAGDIVSFESQQDPKGLRAQSIQLIKRGDDI